MAKLLGLLLIFNCGLLAGWGRALSLEREAKKTGLWRDFLRQFKNCLETTRAAPGEIVRMIAKETAFTDEEAIQTMAAAFCQSGSFAQAVKTAIEEERKPGAAEKILLSLGDTVGIKPLQDQLSALGGAELLMQREWELAQDRSRKYGGLSKRLGALLGLLAAVVLS